MDWDGDRVQRGRLGMDSKFTGTDGDGDKLSSPRSSLFPMSLFDHLAFSIPAFSVIPVLTRANRVLEVARIFTKHSKCCDKFFVLTMSFYTFRAYFATL